MAFVTNNIELIPSPWERVSCEEGGLQGNDGGGYDFNKVMQIFVLSSNWNNNPFCLPLMASHLSWTTST
jgi:hypothetical protein